MTKRAEVGLPLEARAERALVPFATDDDAVLAVFDAMCDTIEGDYSIDDARAILAALDRYLTGGPGRPLADP